MVPADNLIPTYTVFSRHSADCPNKSEASCLRCDCKKWIRVYDPRIEDGKKRQTHFLDQHGQMRRSPFSAKTRSASDAEKIRQALEDSHDPDKRRAAAAEAKLKALQAEKESQTVTIEQAIARFLIAKSSVDNIVGSSLDRYKALLGNVDPKFEVKTKGKFLTWLDHQNPRPIHVVDLTRPVVEDFIGSWNFNAQWTKSTNFTALNSFFNYCTDHKWMPENPMERMKRPKVDKGNRTGAFSDEQWIAIEAAAEKASEVADLGERQKAQRLLTFVRLLRWSGMALVDATQFSKHLIHNGVLTYKRQKTKKTASTKVPQYVLDLLETVSPVNGTPEQPFRNHSITLKANKHNWWRQLRDLFKAAGIGKIKTDVGTLRNPGAHTFRDTFAIGLICARVPIVNVAKALGDTIKMVEDHYMPWIEKMKEVQVEETSRAVAHQLEKLEALKNVPKKKVVNIGGGRK
jgi:integrase